MHLPVNPPILPMLAKRVGALPDGEDWIFEPKWDGFRALVFRDGDEILIQSRDEKPLNRYFPDLLDPLRASLPSQCLLDGEIVIVRNDGLDFDALQLRLHPAASRVKLLAEQTPSSFVCFDLLCRGNKDLRGEPFKTRRRELESLIAKAPPPIHLTPATNDRRVASDWFRRFEGAGSLLLGLFDDAGALQHVGVCASFTAEKRRELAEFLEPYRKNALADHPWKSWASPETPSGEVGQRVPGGQSRWSQGKDLSWEPLRPELVVEVAYEHMQGSRFRHMAHFRRWRSDKKPTDCTYAQLEVVPPQELAAIFSRGL
jgi:ATP-dependent DNA ligase